MDPVVDQPLIQLIENIENWRISLEDLVDSLTINFTSPSYKQTAESLEKFRHCCELEQQLGLRLTLTELYQNIQDLRTKEYAYWSLEGYKETIKLFFTHRYEVYLATVRIRASHQLPTPENKERWNQIQSSKIQ